MSPRWTPTGSGDAVRHDAQPATTVRRRADRQPAGRAGEIADRGRSRTAAVTAGEALVIFALALASVSRAEIATHVGRARCTVARALAKGPERYWAERERAAARQTQRAAGRHAAGKRGRELQAEAHELRPVHVTAPMWSAKWLEQQQQAFAAAMREASC